MNALTINEQAALFADTVAERKARIARSWERTPIMGDIGSIEHNKRMEDSLLRELAHATGWDFFSELPKELQEECINAKQAVIETDKANKRYREERRKQNEVNAREWVRAIQSTGKPKVLARKAITTDGHEGLEVGDQFFISTHELRQAARGVILGRRA